MFNVSTCWMITCRASRPYPPWDEWCTAAGQGQLGLRDSGAQQGGLSLYVQGAGRKPDVARQLGQPSRNVARAPQDLNATAGYRRLNTGGRLHVGKQQRRDQEGLPAAEALPQVIAD